MKYILRTLLFLSLLAPLGCGNTNDTAADAESGPYVLGQTLFYGGDIITMEGDSPAYPEALVQQEGKIVYVGSLAEAEEQYSNATRQNLNGRTLVPGFIDGHAHFGGFGAQAVTANLLASPDGSVDDMDALVESLKTWYAENGTDKTNGWIVGMGYDDAVLAENRHPTKEDLDKVATDVPILIVHISGHFAAVNSKALEEIGYSADTPNPEGGIIRRMAGSNEPNGVLEELAAIPITIKTISPTEPAMVDFYMERAQEMALSFGYTTAQEGRAMTNHEQLADYARRDKFKLDVVSYIDYAFMPYLNSEWNKATYTNNYRIGGIKLTLDGSPQGRTAWRTTPYLLPPDGQQEGYSGYPVIPNDANVEAILDSAFANNWQLLSHCNGDAAADQLFRNMRKVTDKYGNEGRRDVLIHGQLIRMDQLDTLKALNMVASLFPMHTFYWGDWYKQIIGPDAAQRISPIKSALNKGLHVTSHTDAPVAFPNLMMILHTTVNRVTRSGDVLGPEERLTPYEALKAITIWGAYQHFEEDTKGTLTEGKLADLVILDKNPLKVDPMTLKDIVVMETIKEGESVYLRE